MDKVNEKASVYDYARMCKAFKNKCGICPISIGNNGTNELCAKLVMKHPDKANEIILNWCKEHPIKTRQDALLKMFPNARTDSDGVIEIAPCAIETGRYDMTAQSCTMSHKYTNCGQCRKEYWLAEVNENE